MAIYEDSPGTAVGDTTVHTEANSLLIRAATLPWLIATVMSTAFFVVVR